MSTHNIHLKYRTPKKYPTIISIMPPVVAPIVTFRGSKNRCLEQIFMVPKRFEPSKFDCIYSVAIRKKKVYTFCILCFHIFQLKGPKYATHVSVPGFNNVV